MMKKIVSFILAVVLVLAMSVTAFADGNNNNVKDRGFYDFDANWWYDWYGEDGNDLYFFDEDELNEVKYGYAEAMSRAEGLAALYHLITELQNNGMRLTRYEVVKEKTANHVYYIEVMNRDGQLWSCYFCSFTHQTADKVMNAMLNGKKIPYYYIFLTNYVEGQKIKNYGETEQITGFDKGLDEAIRQFINVLNNYDYYYSYFYGYDNYEPEWDPEWDGGVG